MCRASKLSGRCCTPSSNLRSSAAEAPGARAGEDCADEPAVAASANTTARARRLLNTRVRLCGPEPVNEENGPHSPVHGVHRLASCYQYTLAPSWNCRGAFRIEVMLAKFRASRKLSEPGRLNDGVFVRLKASARISNCRWPAILNCLAT